MKILVINDSLALRRMQKNILKQLGYGDVIEGSDGDEVMSLLFAHQDVALILMDWNMRRVSGLEALKQVKADPYFQKIPVMMVTTESEKHRILEAIHAGALNYIIHPFEPDVLRDKIRSILAQVG